jgi:hypothetical protein
MGYLRLIFDLILIKKMNSFFIFFIELFGFKLLIVNELGLLSIKCIF